MREVTKEIENKLKTKALESFANADIQNPNPEQIMDYFEMLKSAYENEEYELEE